MIIIIVFRFVPLSFFFNDSLSVDLFHVITAFETRDGRKSWLDCGFKGGKVAEVTNAPQ